MSRRLLYICVLLTIASCGEFQKQGNCTFQGDECHDPTPRPTPEHTSTPIVIQGPQGPRGQQGEKGDTGDTGTSGRDGTNGSGCSITQTANGAIITCGDGTTSVILNGTNGQDAVPSAYSISQIIDPCGKQGAYDEVLLKTYSGDIIAHYSDGSREFLSLVGPGNYVTTDGTHCYFTINSLGQLTNQHN